MREQHEIIHLFRRQSLRANVARACRNCGAPGYWHNVEGVNPGCYDPAKHAEAMIRHEGFAPVGRVCPQCGAERDDVEEHGEIWSRVWRSPSLWELIIEKMKRSIWRFE